MLVRVYLYFIFFILFAEITFTSIHMNCSSHDEIRNLTWMEISISEYFSTRVEWLDIKSIFIWTSPYFISEIIDMDWFENVSYFVFGQHHQLTISWRDKLKAQLRLINQSANHTAVQSQKAVTAYFSSKQLLPISFAEWHKQIYLKACMDLRRAIKYYYVGHIQ